MLASERGQGIRDLPYIRFNQRECFAHQQHRRRIRDILRRRAPMTVLAEAISAERVQLPHHTQDRVADALAVVLKFREMVLLDTAVPIGLFGYLFRNDTERRLTRREAPPGF